MGIFKKLFESCNTDIEQTLGFRIKQAMVSCLIKGQPLLQDIDTVSACYFGKPVKWSFRTYGGNIFIEFEGSEPAGMRTWVFTILK